MSKSRLVVDLSSSPANSRASCTLSHPVSNFCILSLYNLCERRHNDRFTTATRRSRGDKTLETFSANTVSYPSTVIRRTRRSATSTVASVNGDEELTDDLPPPSMIRSSVMKGKGKATISRASMSSISTANDYATSSGYSTPATSAVTTPAVLPKKENISR